MPNAIVQLRRGQARALTEPASSNATRTGAQNPALDPRRTVSSTTNPIAINPVEFNRSSFSRRFVLEHLAPADKASEMSPPTMQYNQTELSLAVTPELPLLDQFLGQSGSLPLPYRQGDHGLCVMPLAADSLESPTPPQTFQNKSNCLLGSVRLASNATTSIEKRWLPKVQGGQCAITSDNKSLPGQVAVCREILVRNIRLFAL